MERKKKIFILLFLFVTGIIIAFKSPVRTDEGAEDKIVRGGVLGGPVSIGGGRISVKEKTKNASVKINGSGIYPSAVNISSGAILTITNKDPSANHKIGFYGEQKSAVLRPEYSYRITMTSEEEYEFYVSFENGSKEGIVRVK